MASSYKYGTCVAPHSLGESRAPGHPQPFRSHPPSSSLQSPPAPGLDSLPLRWQMSLEWPQRRKGTAWRTGFLVRLTESHLRMSDSSDCPLSPSMLLLEAPWALGPDTVWPRGRAWTWFRLFRSPLVPPPVSLVLGSRSWYPNSPGWALAGLALSPWDWCSGVAVGGLCRAEVQKLRTEQRLPQLCSHCVRTLWVMATFTSSPHVRSRFTRSTKGLRNRSREVRVSGQGSPLISMVVVTPEALRGHESQPCHVPQRVGLGGPATVDLGWIAGLDLPWGKSWAQFTDTGELKGMWL